MLTNQVEENLREAEGCLRNALHWAAKNERPMVCSTVAEMISRIDALIHTDALLDTLENRKQGDSGFFGTFFGKDD
jgi:chromosomal replication initiation ATPase DnaA